MNDNDWKLPQDMKITLGLKPDTDNRTLNKYVRNGKLEVMQYSKKVKVYRNAVMPIANNENNKIEDDWILEEAAQ